MFYTKTVAMGVEEKSLFWFLDVENAGLIHQKDGCNFSENSAIMPRLERCPVRQKSINEAQ